MSTALKVHINRAKSRDAGGCQFCQHEMDLAHRKLVFSSKYVYVLTITSVQQFRFCPRHLGEFFAQLFSELRRIKRNLKRKNGNKDK